MATLYESPDDQRRQAGIDRLTGAQPGLVDELGRQVGLTARAGLKGVGNLVGLLSDPIGGVINAATGSKLQTAGSLADTVSDAIGLPQPKNGTERVVQDAASAMASGAPLIGAGSRLAQSAAPAVRSIGTFLGANPIAQTASNAASAAGASAANENGAGPIGQVAAGVAGSMFPFAAQASGRAAGKIAQVAYDNAGAVPAVRGPLAQQDGIFAGHLSKDAPTWKLEQAKTLQAKGVPDEQIYKDTGWFAGMPDKQWRYEIPDNQASLKPQSSTAREYMNDMNAEYPLKTDQIVSHPDLFGAYPDLGQMNGRLQTYRGGAYTNHNDKESITVYGKHDGDEWRDPAQTSSTLLHELQHAVQTREGFARGGSADHIEAYPSRYVSPDTIEYAKSLPAYARSADKDGFVNSYAGMQLGDPHEAYRRLAGEAEARLVQKRMDYTPEQRAAIYPPSEFDVPANQQIVRFDGNGPQQSVSPYPQQQALETARQNAVKMLGLPEANTPMERAKAMGFKTENPLYHGTTADVPKFDLGFNGSDGVAYDTPGVFMSPDTRLASDYAVNKFDRGISDAMRQLEQFKNKNSGVYDDQYEQLYRGLKDSFASAKREGRPETGGGANVLPLMVRGDLQPVDAGGKRYMQAIPDELRAASQAGKDGVSFANVIDNASPATNYPTDVTAVFNPANVRSRFAAFDPARVNDNDLLGAANPHLLSYIAGGVGAGAAAKQMYDYYKQKSGK